VYANTLALLQQGIDSLLVTGGCLWSVSAVVQRMHAVDKNITRSSKEQVIAYFAEGVLQEIYGVAEDESWETAFDLGSRQVLYAGKISVRFD